MHLCTPKYCYCTPKLRRLMDKHEKRVKRVLGTERTARAACGSYPHGIQHDALLRAFRRPPGFKITRQVLILDPKE